MNRTTRAAAVAVSATLVAAAGAVVVRAAVPPRLTPVSVRHMLASRGLPATSTVLARDDNAGWDHVAAGIAAGDPAWIALIPRLRGSGNAAGTESLRIALSDALQHNPAAVLPLLGPVYPLIDICMDNQIEPPPEVLHAWYAATLAALTRLTPSPARDACLGRVRATRPP